MKNENNIDELKEFLEEYLRIKGINPKKLIRCFSREHEDKNPSMSFYEKANICHCFACKKNYNIFQLVGEEYGIANFKDQLKKVQELYNNRELIKDANETIYSKKNTSIEIEENINLSQNNKMDEIILDREKYSFKKIKECNEYILECEKNLKDTKYLTERGISEEIQKQYHIGYDPNFKNGEWKAIIIPTNYTSFTARNTDKNSDDRLRKIGKSAIFNYWELNAPQNKDKDFFIVEGEIDALSIATVGQKAIALGSTANINLFVEKIKNDGYKNRFFLLLDNDEVGRKAEIELFEKLKAVRDNVIKITPSILKEYKDPNEYLMNNPKDFKNLINTLPQFIDFKKDLIKDKILSQEAKEIFKNSLKKNSDKEEIRETISNFVEKYMQKSNLKNIEKEYMKNKFSRYLIETKFLEYKKEYEKNIQENSKKKIKNREER